MKKLMALLALAAAPVPAAAQQAPTAPPRSRDAATAPSGAATQRWAVSDQSVAFVPARLAFPLRPGTLTAARHQELSAEGEGIDNAIQYRSADGGMFATVYIYLPGLPHPALAALATDDAIRSASPNVSGGALRVVSAGNREGIALRADYGNYQGRLASSAAFLKFGRWLVKVRVSGPTARAAEVESAMAALLAGIRWGVNPPRPAQPITVAACDTGAGTADARALPDPAGGEIAAHGFLATFDGGGIEAQENGRPTILGSRVPTELCRSSYIDLEHLRMPILRGAAGEPLSIDGRTRLVALIDDAGLFLEVVHAPNLGRYLVLMHRMGGTEMLGGFDGVPSDRQIRDIAYGRDTASRSRVTVRFPAEGGTEMQVPADS